MLYFALLTQLINRPTEHHQLICASSCRIQSPCRLAFIRHLNHVPQRDPLIP